MEPPILNDVQKPVVCPKNLFSGYCFTNSIGIVSATARCHRRRS